MKKIFVLALFMLVVSVSNAQDVFKKGDNLIGAQVGIGNGLAVSATYEKCVVDKLFDGFGSIGVGGYLGYAHDKDEYQYNLGEYGGYEAGWKYDDIILGVRGNLHYQFVKRLDTYAGLMLGYEIVNAKSYGKGIDEFASVVGEAEASGVAFSIHIGTRYYFTENFGAMIEVGYGVAYANVGLAYKF